MKKLAESFTLDTENFDRLDALLAKRYFEHSRTYFQELIQKQKVLLNGQVAKKRLVPTLGDLIEVTFISRPGPDLTPEAIPLDILYEDQHIIAVNKSPGMVVHPAPGNWSSTFVNALLYHCNLAPTSEFRPGIVHRLDKETSGVIIAAKSELAHQRLVDQFSKREIQKEYIAIALGKVSATKVSKALKRCPNHRKKMAVSLDEDAKEAITEIELLAFNGTFSKVLVKPKTGRTHQIRVHLSYLKNPILGDKLYGSDKLNQKFNVDRHYLHAKKISFVHPITGTDMVISAPLPKEMESIFICGF